MPNIRSPPHTTDINSNGFLCISREFKSNDPLFLDVEKQVLLTFH